MVAEAPNGFSGSVGKRVIQAYLLGCEFESHQGHMAYLRVGGRVTICEDFIKDGHNYKNESGRVLMITRKMVTVEVGRVTLFVPRNKVVAQ